MSGPVRPEVDPLDAAWVQAQAKGNAPSDPLDAAWLHSNLTPSDGNPLHAEYAKGLLANRMQRENQNGQEQAQNAHLNPLQRGLAAIANTAAGIPGVEAAQAGASALVNRIPYRQALGDIQGAESEINPVASFTNRLAGGAIAAPLLPGGPAAQGALFGGASGLLNASPDAGIAHRVLSGGAQAVVGAGVGKLAEGATSLARSLFARAPGAQAQALKGAIQQADAANYGQAAQEGSQAMDAERSMLADVRARMARVMNAGKQLALPAPGQSEAARAALDARPLRGPGGQFATPPELPMSLEEAAKHDYTNVLPEPTPAPETPAVYDYTNPRPVRLQAANDVNVRTPPATPSTVAPSGPPAKTPLGGLRTVLESPGVQEYTQAVLNSPRFAKADAPTVAAEIYRQMSADQRLLARQAFADPSNFKPGASIKLGDIGQAKSALLDAMDPVAPSFRQAVEQHAALSGQRDMAQMASDAAPKIMRDATIPFKKLTSQSPEAVMRQIAGANASEKQAAYDALLGRLKQRSLHGITANPLRGFGIPKAIESGARLSPFLNAAGSDLGPLQALFGALPSTVINKP